MSVKCKLESVYKEIFLFGNGFALLLGRGLHLDRVVIYRLDGVVVRDIREDLGVIGDLVIDLEGIPGGVYIVQIEGDRLFERLKLIKK